jgi:hypothetical protein
MVNMLDQIPDRWLRNFRGLIMCIVTDENVGANVSLDLLNNLDDGQKIAMVSIIAHKLGLEYTILRDHMDGLSKEFNEIEWRDYA